jgi:hypothetical protein
MPIKKKTLTSADEPSRRTIGDLYRTLAITLADILRDERTPETVTAAIAQFVDSVMSLPQGNLAVSASQLNYYLCEIQNEHDFPPKPTKEERDEQTQFLQKMSGIKISPA